MNPEPITTSTGSTLAIESDGLDRIITIRHPDAPEGLRVIYMGRAISFNGGPLGFQPTPTLGFTGAIFGAEALRAVAALLDAESAMTDLTPERRDKMRRALDCTDEKEES